MSKRSKVKTLHTSLRLAPDVAQAVTNGTRFTGWSSARVVAHLVRIGSAVLEGRRDLLSGLENAWQVAGGVHRVELENAIRLAAARKGARVPGPRAIGPVTARAIKRAGRKPAAAPAGDQPAK